MPGIVGIISQRPKEECEFLVKAMVGCMKHEPFYTSGTHATPEMGVYAGWIAHKGSFAAEQIFFNEQKDVALIFSGECFADPQIGRDLKEKGHRIEKNNDWLVHLYEEEGERFFEKLNGLFSGLLIDRRRNKTFLFNDRYGVERIYWHEVDGEFYFASEAKALLRILLELRKFDTDGVVQFLTFGCTLETRTLFRGISILPGGSLWSFEGGKCHKQKYFSPQRWESQSRLSVKHFQSEFEDTFKRTLPRYFESQCKIGIALTAGLDSRMIMACLPKTDEKPVCYTFSGQTRDILDAQLAARVAKTCDLDHTILRIRQDFLSDFASHADRTTYITDGCLGILGAHEGYFNMQARQLAPVRITGNYGSEIFRGASTFKPLGLSPSLISQELPSLGGTDMQGLARQGDHPITFAAFREVPLRRFGVQLASRSQVTFRTPYLDNRIVALAYCAPIELLKSPASALRLIKENDPALAQIPTDMGMVADGRRLSGILHKFYCKATFKIDYLYTEGLPHRLCWLEPLLKPFNSRSWILERHKFLRYRTWFQRELAPYISEALRDVRLSGSQFWSTAFLERMASDHIRAQKNYVREIDAVLTLDAVERLLFRNLPREREPLGSARSLKAETASL